MVAENFSILAQNLAAGAVETMEESAVKKVRKAGLRSL